MTYSMKKTDFSDITYILYNHDRNIAKYLCDDRKVSFQYVYSSFDSDELRYIAENWEGLDPYKRTIYKLLADYMLPHESIAVTSNILDLFKYRFDRVARYLFYLETLADNYLYKSHHDAEAFIHLVEHFNSSCMDDQNELKFIPLAINDLDHHLRYSGNLAQVYFLEVKGYLTEESDLNTLLVGLRPFQHEVDLRTDAKKDIFGSVQQAEILETPESIEDYVYPKLNPGYIRAVLEGEEVKNESHWNTYLDRLILRKNRDALTIGDLLIHRWIVMKNIERDVVPIYDYNKLSINEKVALTRKDSMFSNLLSEEEMTSKATEPLVGEDFRAEINDSRYRKTAYAQELLGCNEELCDKPYVTPDFERPSRTRSVFVPRYFEGQGKCYLQFNWYGTTSVVTKTFILPPHGVKLVPVGSNNDLRNKIVFSNSHVLASFNLEDLNKIIGVLPDVPFRTILKATAKHMRPTSRLYTLDLIERGTSARRILLKISKFNTYFNHYRNLVEILIFREDYILILFNELVTKYEKLHKSLLNTSGNLKYFPYFGVYKNGKLIDASTSLISLKHMWGNEEVTYSYEIDTNEQTSRVDKDLRDLRRTHELRKDHRVLIPDLAKIELVNNDTNDFKI